MSVESAVLVAVALAFAYSLGAHYTGACMGMTCAAGILRVGPALLMMAPLVLVGATFVSGRVEATVSQGLLRAGSVGVGLALVIVSTAAALTFLYNFLKLPTSTIQILVFAVAGAATASGVGVQWGTVGQLMVVWALAPLATFGLAYLLVRVIDRGSPETKQRARATGPLAIGLLAAGLLASLVMGENDVANASGPLLMTGLFTPLTAGFLGGIGLAVGVVLGGKPLLRKVSSELVDLDPATATGAQFAQGAVVFSSASLGYFTSLNQALIGAMAGAGLARGRGVLRWDALRGVLIGWAVGPTSAFAGAYAVGATAHFFGLA